MSLSDTHIFAKNRLQSAQKIAADAKAKGGDSLLTYEHYKVKIPYYAQAANGSMSIDNAKAQYRDLLYQLYNDNDSLDQIEFQQLIGRIEVLGELIINSQ